MRDYGLPPVEWETVRYRPMAGMEPMTVEAWRGSLGLERTPEEYVGHLVAVFREVRRVLHPTGTAWCNLGDAYSAGGGKQVVQTKHASYGLEGMRQQTPTMPSKQLMMIPARVALALQADGWWLRSAPPWLKKNCMPESVTDRFTTSHEYWFQLNKAARYHFDAEAVRVPSTAQNGQAANFARGTKDHLIPGQTVAQHRTDRKPTQDTGGRNRRTSDVFYDSLDVLIEEQAAYLAHLRDVRDNGGMMLDEDGDPLALLFNTKGFKGAHFATFNADLITPLVKCSTSERGCCPECGASWERVVERTGHVNKREPAHCPNNADTKTDSTGWAPMTRATDNWTPTCTCDAGEPVSCTALDPFFGAGTTGLVCERLGRDSIGIELSEKYVQMAQERIVNDAPMLNQVEVRT